MVKTLIVSGIIIWAVVFSFVLLSYIFYPASTHGFEVELKTYKVNRNTVMRTYAILQEAGIFDNKRGIGFFISENAAELVRATEKINFFAHELPDFVRKVKLIKLNSNDLTDLVTEIKNNDHENK